MTITHGDSHEFAKNQYIAYQKLYKSFGGLGASSGHGRSRVLLVVQNWLFPSFPDWQIRFYFYLLLPNLVEATHGKLLFSTWFALFFLFFTFFIELIDAERFAF